MCIINENSFNKIHFFVFPPVTTHGWTVIKPGYSKFTTFPGGFVRAGSVRGITSTDVCTGCRASVPAPSFISMKSWGRCNAGALLTTKSSYTSKGLEKRP